MSNENVKVKWKITVVGLCVHCDHSRQRTVVVRPFIVCAGILV